MKKGQQSTLTAVALLPVIVVSILITFWVYGSVSEIVPHDVSYTNESLCTACHNTTLYTFDNAPIVNDSTLICYNDSINLMTNGPVVATCLGYTIINGESLNITNTSVANGCQTEDVVCSYTYDWANANEQGFWDTSTTNINSGYSLGSVVPIIFAAVIVMGVIFLLGKRG